MAADTPSDNNYQRDIVSDMLLPGESIIRIATISPGIYWKSIIVLLAALVALLLYGLWLGVYGLVIGGIMLLLASWTRNYLVLAATDHRLIIRAGVLNQEVLQLRYPQIETIDTLYTPVGLFLGYGSVIITGTGMSRWMVPFVRDATAFRDEIMQKLLEREEPLAHQPASYNPPTGNPPSISPP